jgi:solute carrier family 25 phosphate transporter 3
MPSLFPSYNALSAVFGGKTTPDNPTTEQQRLQGSQHLQGSQRSQHDAPAGRYQVWSVTEDAERKASELSKAAAKEYQKASAVAQTKVGGIELYSGKYCELFTLFCLGVGVGVGAIWFEG